MADTATARDAANTGIALGSTSGDFSSSSPASNETSTKSGEETALPSDLNSSSNGQKKMEEDDEAAGTSAVTPKEPKLKALTGKLGLDIGTIMIMFKGSLPPVIGIAFFQATPVAEVYGTLGYLVPIISIIALCILPRARFLQALFLNLVGVCVGASIGLLGTWSAVQARIHTAPNAIPGSYNSSQSVVCAVWLFANIWFVNTLRAKLPQLQITVIMYSIFTNISFTFGPRFTSTAICEEFIKSLLQGFLTAFGIAFGVSIIIIPISSRDVVAKEQASFIALVRVIMKRQTSYLTSLESSDMFAPLKTVPTGMSEPTTRKEKRKVAKAAKKKMAESESAKLKASTNELTALFGKMSGDLSFGKREIAFGKLDAKDLDDIFKLFRHMMIPLLGIATLTDIFERIAERRGWIQMDSKNVHDEAEAWEHSDDKTAEKCTWNEVMKVLHEPFAIAMEVMDEGMEHAGKLLEIIPEPKKRGRKAKKAAAEAAEDVEAKGDGTKPGDPAFATYYEQKINDTWTRRGQSIRAWAAQKGISDEQFDAGNLHPSGVEQFTAEESQHRRDQQQLYLILYLEALLHSTGIAVLDFVKYADKKVADGTMSKKRLITPGYRRIVKWFRSVGAEDQSGDSDNADILDNGASTIQMGSGFDAVKKDPEHLPPSSLWQRVGNGLRTIPAFLGSAESAFGFRVACATMTVGIAAFLESSQVFFAEQRLVWAMIIIAIGMTMTTGQSIFGFLGRIAGTTISMITSLIIWYIVDQKTPGVIVFLWFFVFLEMYFFLKFPRFLPIWLISMITQVLIIGYELQTRKIGVAAAEQSGQPYYPVYELGPYRLACVAGGSFVAFLWTFLPYPLTDRSWLRKDLGATIYLLANYYSVLHSTINARIHGTEGDMSVKSSPGRQLEKIRNKLFGKLILLIPSLRQHAEFQRWEISIGGKFPRETYNEIIHRCSNLLRYMSLMAFASQIWQGHQNTNANNKWHNDLTALVDTVAPTSNEVTSTLSLLAASIRSGSALPPYMRLPHPFELSRRLEQLDKGILDIRHVEEPGYAAYAVMQVVSSLISDDLSRLIADVKELVGEVDFSFSLKDPSMDSVSTMKGKAD